MHSDDISEAFNVYQHHDPFQLRNLALEIRERERDKLAYVSHESMRSDG